MLEIKNLSVEVNEKEILKDVNLKIKGGEVHAIMGVNGSGKSTLALTLMGHPRYKVTRGKIIFNGKNILEMKTDERAREGIFLSIQYPTEVEGVRLGNFLFQSIKKLTDNKNLIEFRKELKEKAREFDFSEEIVDRDLNLGFSGGERKKSEILQMHVLKPKLAIIDEVDSGLDIDSLKKIASKINEMKDVNFSCLLITHYQRILNYIKPNFVHVMIDGKIVKTGNEDVVKEIEEKGYAHLK